MNTIWKWIGALVEPSPDVTSPTHRLEARFIATIHLIVGPVAALAIILQPLVNPALIWSSLTMSPFFVLMGVSWFLARTQLFRLATWLTMVLLILTTSVSVLGDPSNAAPYAYYVMTPLLASVTLNRQETTIVSIVSFLAAMTLLTINFDQIGPKVAVTVLVMVLVNLLLVGLTTAHGRLVEDHRTLELRARDARQATLLQAAFGGLAVVRDGVVVDASPGFAALFGYPAEELVGRRLATLLIAGPDEAHNADAMHRTGRVFPVELIAHPYDEAGVRQEIVAVRDLAERLEIQAKLHQADRMATMGQLAAGVAHEINNPLAWVRGNLDLLSERLSGPESDIASRAAEGARRVQRIVQDLKTFSRTHTPEPTAVDLSRAAASAANMVRHKMRDRGVLVEDYADAPTVDGDETRVGQVCMNLLVNAIEALPEDQRDTSLVSLRVYPNDAGEPVIEVEDNGPGIPADVRHRMFDPFFTTKPQGTGLGMAITRSLVGSLGGRLEVKSSMGIGTVISVILPPGKLEYTQTPKPVENRQNRPLAKVGRLLIVDDEPDITALLAEVLCAHEVHRAHSMTEAMSVVDDSWDGILCDLMMPGATGMDLHEAAISLQPALAERFVFMTGGVYTPETQDFLQRTARPVLTKPFDLKEVVAAVDRLIQTPLR